MNATERIKFAVSFSREKLQLLSARGLKQLREDVFGAFLGLGLGPGKSPGTIREQGGHIAIPDELSAAIEGPILVWSRDDYKHLQANVRSLLREVIEAKEQPGYSRPVSAMSKAKWEIVHLSKAFGWEKNALVPSIGGSAHDLFLIRLFLLLIREGIDRLRKCPECGNVFYRVRRQIRCSSACTNRAAQRAFKDRVKKRRQRRRRHHR